MENKKRLIDANALCDLITATFPQMSYNAMYMAIENAPTVDAVEVVRCKDCKHFISDICRFDFGLNYSCGDDFCSHGERKDAE